MKILLTLLISSILITGCRNANKDEDPVVLPDNTKDENPIVSSKDSEFISQRHLLDKKLGDYNFITEKQWDSLNAISHKKVLHKKGKVRPDIRTFGWHLYSNGTVYKNYNFSMLWGLSYFSYSIQPETGSYKNIHQWKTTSVIDSAKANGCKIFFSVSNFGSENNAVFLENPRAQNTLIDSLSSLLALRAADGINIDFEGVPKKNRADFTNFIREISKRLKKDNNNYMVSLCLYATDWNDIFDIESIDPFIDFYTLMGYDYYGSFSKTTGPVTPFKKSEKFGNGLETSVNYYKNKGVNFSKLIVGLPYYGAEWYTKNLEIGGEVIQFKSHPPYREIRKFYIDSYKLPVQFDPESASSYMTISENNRDRQLFFEDVKSLSIKYDWIKNNNLGGVGIWALGYDDGYPELWNLLTEKFSEK